MHSRDLKHVMPSAFSRVVAAFGAWLVMLLTLSSVSPELHAWLHASAKRDLQHTCSHRHAHTHSAGSESIPVSPDSDNHDCAVTLFAHGVVYHAANCVAQPYEGILRAVNYRAFKRLVLAQPRYLHLPPQAPPAV